MFGLETICPDVVVNRIAWSEGRPYDPELIGKTEFELESLGLFSSISILENEQELVENELPIEIYLREGVPIELSVLGSAITRNWGPVEPLTGSTATCAEWESASQSKATFGSANKWEFCSM